MNKESIMRCFFGMAFGLLLLSCNNTTPETTVRVPDSSDRKKTEDTVALATALVPGDRVGHITLGLVADSIEPFLGPPDSSDAAMGKAWLTWINTRNASVLNIYTTYADSSMAQKTVQQVRTTSPYFKTRSNLHAGSTLAEIETQFPALVKAATYTVGDAPVTLYDAVTEGIAFEVTGGVCTGIVIHKKGNRADAVYIMLHPGMKRL